MFVALHLTRKGLEVRSVDGEQREVFATDTSVDKDVRATVTGLLLVQAVDALETPTVELSLDGNDQQAKIVLNPVGGTSQGLAGLSDAGEGLMQAWRWPMFQFDERDENLRKECVDARERIAGSRLGDFVRLPAGQVERISHRRDDAVQTSPVDMASFFLCRTGGAEMSGSLNPFVPRQTLALSNETRQGIFWFFHHGVVGAGRAVYFTVPCRVFDTTAQYEGFLKKRSAFGILTRK